MSRSAVPDPSPATGSGRRLIRRRPGLPGTRSVVGGLLVAMAAIGTWWAAAGEPVAAKPRFLVAARPIGPGERIERDDLALAPADLPGAVTAGLFRDPDELEGAIALGPLQPGELVQAGAVSATAPGGSVGELSFAVDTDWAVAGRLRPGDRIDVYATDDGSTTPRSRRVLTDVVLRRVDQGDDRGLGGGTAQTLTVAIDDPGAVAETVAATRAGPITVVRVTGAERTADAPSPRVDDPTADGPEGSRPGGGATTTVPDGTVPDDPRTTTTTTAGR